MTRTCSKSCRNWWSRNGGNFRTTLRSRRNPNVCAALRGSFAGFFPGAVLFVLSAGGARVALDGAYGKRMAAACFSELFAWVEDAAAGGGAGVDRDFRTPFLSVAGTPRDQ